MAYYGIGNSYYFLGDFANALNWHQKGLETMSTNNEARKSDIGNSIVMIAYDYEGLQDYDNALIFHEKSSSNFDPDSHRYHDSVFSRGRVHTILWADKEYPENGEHHGAALDRFDEFLNIGGKPTHWAEYNLICLRVAESSRKEEFEELGVLLLELTKVLRDLKSPTKGPIHRQYFRDIVLNNNWARKASLPIVCPSLTTLFENCDCQSEVEKIMKKEFAFN